MIKPLEDAIETVSRLPEEDQALAAEMLQLIASRHNAAYTMTTDEAGAAQAGLREADRGDFVSREKLESLLKRPWG